MCESEREKELTKSHHLNGIERKETKRRERNGEMIRDFVTEEQFHAADKVKIGQVSFSTVFHVKFLLFAL